MHLQSDGLRAYRTFIGREDTGWRSSVIYTFVEQIRGHRLDPFADLEWVFEKLMHDGGALKDSRANPQIKLTIQLPRSNCDRPDHDWDLLAGSEVYLEIGPSNFPRLGSMSCAFLDSAPFLNGEPP